MVPLYAFVQGRSVALSVVVLAVAGLSGCGGNEELTADSTCREFLDRPAEERADAAIRISTELQGVSSPGNPMWAASVEAACGSAPSVKLREAFGGGFERTDRPDDESGDSAAEPETADAAPTPGADGTASDDTVAAVFAAAPVLEERIYAMEWRKGKLILDVANVAEAEEHCAEIKDATGAKSISARQAADQTRLC